MPWEPEFYEENGIAFVKDFILAQANGAIAEIIHVLKLLYKFNVTLGPPYVKKVDKSGLRELRIKHGTDYYRILYCVYGDKKFKLLHAIVKKTDTLPEPDKKLAISRMKKLFN